MMEIRKGWKYRKDKGDWWNSKDIGRICTVMAFVPPNVHVRWENRTVHCFNERDFREYFVLPEFQNVVNLLDKYEDAK